MDNEIEQIKDKLSLRQLIRQLTWSSIREKHNLTEDQIAEIKKKIEASPEIKLIEDQIDELRKNIALNNYK